MGFTNLPITIKNPARPTKSETGKFLIDSGALYSVVPAKKLKGLGIKPAFTQTFTLSNGDTVSWPVGNALFKYQDKEVGSPVIFGEKADIYLLGITTLESFGYVLDPITRDLRKVPMLLM